VFLDPARVGTLFEDAGVAFDEPRFFEAELRARGRVAAGAREGHDGTEADLWSPYFREVLEGSGAPQDRLEALGLRLRAAHAEAHLWSWAPPEVGAALARLQEHGYRLAAISNADGRMERALITAGLRDQLEFVIDSGHVGVAKPDPRIFAMGAERLDLDSSQCAYVGDMLPIDVLGAQRAGMHPVLVDPLDQFAQVSVDRVRSVGELPDLFRTTKDDS